jgi:ketosteroid isomerase-like protein
MPSRASKDIEQETERVFRAVISAWANQDVDGVVRRLADDVVRNINVDGELVPFAASVTGKAAIRERLELALETFETGSYVTDFLRVEGNVARARLRSIMIHYLTGERLNMRFRVVMEQQDGLVKRLDIFHDRHYLEAFARLVARRKDD